MSARQTGTVKWYNGNKGYGFLQPDSGGADIFIHATAIERSGMKSIAEGQRFEFSTEMNKGKSQAVDLKHATEKKEVNGNR